MRKGRTANWTLYRTVVEACRTEDMRQVDLAKRYGTNINKVVPVLVSAKVIERAGCNLPFRVIGDVEALIEHYIGIAALNIHAAVLRAIEHGRARVADISAYAFLAPFLVRRVLVELTALRSVVYTTEHGWQLGLARPSAQHTTGEVPSSSSVFDEASSPMAFVAVQYSPERSAPVECPRGLNGGSIPIAVCIDSYTAANAFMRKDSPCFKCPTGKTRRAAFADYAEEEDDELYEERPRKTRASPVTT